MMGSGAGQQAIEELMQRHKVGFTHVPFDDIPLAVDDESRGSEFDVTPRLGNGPIVVQRNFEWQLTGLSEIQHPCGRIVAHGHSHGFKATVFERLVGLHQRGHFFDARHTRGGPKIHQRDLALQRTTGHDRAIDQQKVGRGQGVARAARQARCGRCAPSGGGQYGLTAREIQWFG